MKNPLPPAHEPKPSSAGGLEERALDQLGSAFERAGWSLEQPPRGVGQLDLLLRKGERALVVELKASPGRSRRAVLRGQLADAVLRSRAWARELDAEPFAVLAAPAISDEIAGELADYMGHVAPGMGWGILDERGRFELYGDGFDAIRPPDRLARPPQRLHQAPAVHNPFSDLGQWMLKVLLADKVPEPWLSAPRDRIRGVADLARIAEVSPASASRLLAALESESYLVDASGGPRLVRVEALLHAWRRSLQRPMERRYARFLLPGKDPYEQLQRVLADRPPHPGSDEANPSGSIAARVGPRGKRACLGLFAACRAHEVGFVRGAPLHLLCEDLSPGLLEGLELAPVEHRAESQLIVVRPRFPEAVFRGCVSIEGVPAADLLQCWLDVSFHAARGEEQADEIAARLGFKGWI